MRSTLREDSSHLRVFQRTTCLAEGDPRVGRRGAGRLPGAAGLLRNRAGFLSGGQQQQLAMARTLVIMDAGEVVRSGDREDLQDPAVRQLLTV
ncbi:hypothetical protein ACFFX1_04275 [Dactylosporangium sucinum]|uniref:ABC transporter domain-containing protein n=1 Tax=Dactylosporangium sucinum TaxID=1424081 RepID=A0A917WMA4_9ACTN|nr:hypothetical protein [Dactylosporangium sucinum]GGM14799.1 hypothetical protein GCM10007977_014900 [Dactylosporangium sucinum]